MKITITGRKVSLRDNFKERVEKKLKKFCRMFGEDASASVTVTVEKRRQTVEVTIRTADGMVYRSEQTAPEMNDALDEVVKFVKISVSWKRKSARWEPSMSF